MSDVSGLDGSGGAALAVLGALVLGQDEVLRKDRPEAGIGVQLGVWDIAHTCFWGLEGQGSGLADS